jgi:hypothetical protein
VEVQTPDYETMSVTHSLGIVGCSENYNSGGLVWEFGYSNLKISKQFSRPNLRAMAELGAWIATRFNRDYNCCSARVKVCCV